MQGDTSAREKPPVVLLLEVLAAVGLLLQLPKEMVEHLKSKSMGGFYRADISSSMCYGLAIF